MTPTRREHDLLGERDLPAERYYGIQTLRALENFQITGIPISHTPRLINSLATIKKAAARDLVPANLALGLLSQPIAAAICQACDVVLSGGCYQEFVVDVIRVATTPAAQAPPPT